MMWPRLRLLHDLLAENGSLWMTLDDNEVHRARCIMDEIFGQYNCVGQIAWQKRTSRENRATLSPSFDHIILYSKALPETWKLRRNLLLPSEDGYSNPDKDPRGVWASIPFSAQGFRENQVYPITTPAGIVHSPPKGRCWAATEPEFEKLKEQHLVYWPKSGNGRPRVKQFPDKAKGLVPMTLWMSSEVGDTEDSKKELLGIFSDRDSVDFHAPKPPSLIRRVLDIATTQHDIVLDSFAGYCIDRTCCPSIKQTRRRRSSLHSRRDGRVCGHANCGARASCHQRLCFQGHAKIRTFARKAQLARH